jgi:hypothetical protein
VADIQSSIGKLLESLGVFQDLGKDTRSSLGSFPEQQMPSLTEPL